MAKKLIPWLMLLALFAYAIISCWENGVSIGYEKNTRKGQTLPTRLGGMCDDIQYFPIGPEFPLSKEASQMERDQAEHIQAGR